MAQTVSWNLLKHWINEKEAHELQTGQPAPLTPVQRDALNALVPGIVPGSWESQAQQFLYRQEQQPQHQYQYQQHQHQHHQQQQQQQQPIPRFPPSSPPSNETKYKVPSPPKSTQSTQVADPEFESEIDWVSKIFQHFQAIARPAPEFNADSVNYGPKKELKFLCYCELAGTDGVFPNKDYGFINGQAPCFSTKKTAKQYSAMCAKKYLEDGLVQRQKRPHTHPAAGKAAGGGASLSSSDEAAAGEPARDHDSMNDNSANKSRKKSRIGSDRAGDSDGDADGNGNGQDLRLVKQLSRRLALGEPQFIVTPTPDKGQGSFFNARADFGAYAEMVPVGLGAVNEIFTKKEAKEASMTEVLQWLRDTERLRQEELDGIVTSPN